MLISAALALPVSAISFTDDNQDGITEGNAELQVKITEILSVSVTTPDVWASGDVDIDNGSDLLRNKVTLKVASNNANGFTASMNSKTTTNLVNKTTAATISTLSGSFAASAFPTNAWGYSVDDADTAIETASYNPMATTAIALSDEANNKPSSLSKDIWFGAKADVTKDSGTYANTIVFTVVSGVITDEDTPVPPVDDPTTPTPSEPGADDQIAQAPSSPTYNGGTVGADDAVVDTNVTNGDVSNVYQDPGALGVTKTDIGSGTPLATGLATTAAVAATSGIIFFIVAKRKKDEEEEEVEEN